MCITDGSVDQERLMQALKNLNESGQLGSEVSSAQLDWGVCE